MGHRSTIGALNYRSTESAAHKIIGAQSDDVRADDFLMVLAPILRNDRDESYGISPKESANDWREGTRSGDRGLQEICIRRPGHSCPGGSLLHPGRTSESRP